MPDLRIVLTIVALIAAMGVSCTIGLRARAGAVLLALLSFVWLTLDHPFEGTVLIKFTPHNGLTTSDLVGVVGLLVAALELWRLRRPRAAAQPTPGTDGPVPRHPEFRP